MVIRLEEARKATTVPATHEKFLHFDAGRAGRTADFRGRCVRTRHRICRGHRGDGLRMEPATRHASLQTRDVPPPGGGPALRRAPEAISKTHLADVFWILPTKTLIFNWSRFRFWT